VNREYFLFPNKVIEHQCDDFLEIKNHLIDTCYEVKKTCEQKKYTMEHGWQSSIHQYENPLFEPFLPFILKHIEICFQLYGFNNDSNYFNLNALVLNINTPGSYQISHIHPNCHMSGALWLKAPQNCGRFGFQSPDCFAKSAIYDYVNSRVHNEEHLKPYHYFEPVEGTMIFFPPDLRHHVETNVSNEDRISLGFNLLIYQK
jgi:uncharacterized protein (TIGR02466 family)